MIKLDQQEALRQDSFMQRCRDTYTKAYKEDEVSMFVAGSPGRISHKSFPIHLSNDWFNVGDFMTVSSNTKLKVLSTPTSKWFLKLFQWITFGLHKAPIYYKVIQVDKQ